MECKKFTIIESYPSILKHNIFIISFIIFIIYFILFVFEILKNFVISLNKSFKLGFIYLKNLFILNKEEHIIGASSTKEFVFNSSDITNSIESDFNNIKNQIQETKIKKYFGKEALNIVFSLNENLELGLDLSSLSKTNFVLKEEIFIINSEEDLLRKDFVLTKGYNKSAINTYNLFKKILK